MTPGGSERSAEDGEDVFLREGCPGVLEPLVYGDVVRHLGKARVIDYTYANYVPEDARAAYVEVADRLADAQTALDLVNSTVTMEIEL